MVEKTKMKKKLDLCDTNPEQIIGNLRSRLLYVLGREDLSDGMRAKLQPALDKVEKQLDTYITELKASLTVVIAQEKADKESIIEEEAELGN